MSPIRWREAEHRDRHALQDFLCTPPVRPRKYGRAAPPRARSWELEAQGVVRALRPPARTGHLILLGEDDHGIAAVTHTINDDGPGVVFVSVFAVALRLRGQPNNAKVGDQLMDELIDRLANRADAAGLDHMTVWGKVHPRNEASKKLCSRAGADTFDEDGLFDRWLTRIDFAD